MDDNADVIQRCIDEQLNHQLGDYEELSTENFRRWVKILEAGTFNPIDQIAINAALYSHKRMATKKIIYDTLLQSGYARSESPKKYGDIEELLKDFGEENQCK